MVEQIRTGTPGIKSGDKVRFELPVNYKIPDHDGFTSGKVIREIKDPNQRIEGKPYHFLVVWAPDADGVPRSFHVEATKATKI